MIRRPNLRPRFLVAGLASVVLLVVAPTRATALEDEGRARPAARAQAALDGAWWSNARVAERLGLTTVQSKAIEEIAFRSGQKQIDLGAELKKAELEIVRLLNADTLDNPALDRAVEKVNNARCALARERDQMRVDIARQLDREQRLTVMRLMREREARAEREGPPPRPLRDRR